MQNVAAARKINKNPERILVMAELQRNVQLHPIAPVWNENSRILILGSFPSVKSRETNFFYGHPQNRFWRVLAAVLGREKPESTEEKKRFRKLLTRFPSVLPIRAEVKA